VDARTGALKEEMEKYLDFEYINTISQVIVNITVIISFVFGWAIYLKKLGKKRKEIKSLKRKINTLNNILPSDKSIDEFLAKTKNEDGSEVQIIISTNDGTIIDSTKESIDNYLRNTKRTIEKTINEIQSSIDDITTP